jgi:hypothetical protein
VYRDHRWYVVQVAANSAANGEPADGALNQIGTSISTATISSVEHIVSQPNELAMSAESRIRHFDATTSMMSGTKDTPRRTAGLVPVQPTESPVDPFDAQNRASKKNTAVARDQTAGIDATELFESSGPAAPEVATYAGISSSCNVAAAVDICLDEIDPPLEFARELASLAEPLAQRHVEVAALFVAITIVAAGHHRPTREDDPMTRPVARVSRCVKESFRS